VPTLPPVAELAIVASVSRDRDHSESEPLLAELLALDTPVARRQAIRTQPERFGNAVLVQQLLKAARSELWGEPRQAAELADLATEVAAVLPPERYGDVLVHEMRLEAEAQAGNAYRVIGELPEAERRLEWVLSRLEEVADPALTADVLSLTGSLRMDQRRLDEAETLLRRAQGLAREIGDSSAEARYLLKRAALSYYDSDPDTAIARVESAVALLDRETHGKAWLMAMHNLAGYLVAAGRAREAQELVTAELYGSQDTMEPLVALRLLWLQAQICHALDQPEAADAGYRQVYTGFRERGMEFAAALVALELSVLLLEGGGTVEPRSLAREAIAVFERAGVPWAVRRAFARLKASIERETVTTAMLRELVCLMESAGGRSNLRSLASLSRLE
jgi:tetratricopeptide (TPR) repeat protein